MGNHPAFSLAEARPLARQRPGSKGVPPLAPTAASAIERQRIKAPMRMLWKLGGAIALLLGIVGAALPLLPTTPFLLLAAFCFARSSPALHQRLLAHPVFGKAIRDWQERKVISRGAKAASVSAMAASLGLSGFLGLEMVLVAVQAAAVSAAALFILTRNSA